MKRSFFSFLLFGICLTALISFAEPQDNGKPSNRRSKATMATDSSRSTPMNHGTNQPKMHKTDSLPQPQPQPTPIPVPRPDTMSRKMMR